MVLGVLLENRRVFVVKELFDVDLILDKQLLLLRGVRCKRQSLVPGLLDSCSSEKVRLVGVPLNDRLELGLHLIELLCIVRFTPGLPDLLLLVVREGRRPHQDRPWKISKLSKDHGKLLTACTDSFLRRDPRC